jgi:hypothetical protein
MADSEIVAVKVAAACVDTYEQVIEISACMQSDNAGVDGAGLVDVVQSLIVNLLKPPINGNPERPNLRRAIPFGVTAVKRVAHDLSVSVGSA